MRVKFEQVAAKEQESALIRAVAKTEDIRNAMELLEGRPPSVAVLEEGSIYFCKTRDIYYAESVDKRTYIYTKDSCYETKYRLYELEGMLGAYFVRCSKAMIVNLKKVRSVKSELGGRLDAALLNGEHVVISRSYVREVKRRLGLSYE